MTDSYLAIAEIADDEHMTNRVTACVAQQAELNSLPVGDAVNWTMQNRFNWASAPSWGEKWESSKVTHVDDEGYEPGRDGAVITDGDILATVQHLIGT